jgi:Uma2 family endonuclease
MNAPLQLKRPIVYPESDGKPMSDNTRQMQWIVVLYDNLKALFVALKDVFVAGDLLWYPIEGQPEVRAAPDVLVVFGRPAGHRGSYKQWEEDNVPVTVVFEILSPKNSVLEMDDKLAFYEEHGVEYYLYDPDTNRLKIWIRRGEVFRRQHRADGFVSPRLGIRFDLSGPELIVWGPDGRRFLTFEEVQIARKQAEQEAELANQRAEQAEQRADQAQPRDPPRGTQSQVPSRSGHRKEIAELDRLRSRLQCLDRCSTPACGDRRTAPGPGPVDQGEATLKASAIYAPANPSARIRFIPPAPTSLKFISRPPEMKRKETHQSPASATACLQGQSTRSARRSSDAALSGQPGRRLAAATAAPPTPAPTRCVPEPDGSQRGDAPRAKAPGCPADLLQQRFASPPHLGRGIPPQQFPQRRLRRLPHPDQFCRRGVTLRKLVAVQFGQQPRQSLRVRCWGGLQPLLQERDRSLRRIDHQPPRPIGCGVILASQFAHRWSTSAIPFCTPTRSQTRTVVSCMPVANFRPSGEKAM